MTYRFAIDALTELVNVLPPGLKRDGVFFEGELRNPDFFIEAIDVIEERLIDLEKDLEDEYDKGYSDGSESGYENGHNDGYNDGRNDGRDECCRGHNH